MMSETLRTGVHPVFRRLHHPMDMKNLDEDLTNRQFLQPAPICLPMLSFDPGLFGLVIYLPFRLIRSFSDMWHQCIAVGRSVDARGAAGSRYRFAPSCWIWILIPMSWRVFLPCVLLQTTSVL